MEGYLLLLNNPRRRVSIWVPSYWLSLISFQADFRSDFQLVASNLRHCVEHLTVFSLNSKSVELWGFYHRHPLINDSALCCEIPGSILWCAPQIPLILIPLFTRNLEANDGDLTGRQNGITPVWFLRLCKLKILLKLIHSFCRIWRVLTLYKKIVKSPLRKETHQKVIHFRPFRELHKYKKE